MKYPLSPDLPLSSRVVTEKLGFIGRTGSGKSYAAMKLAEVMHAAAAQFVVLDPVGIWYGLRLAADGKRPGLPIPVLGGLHGDIPLEPTGGALIANLVVDRGTSIVLDVSQFESDADKARFAHAFADRFFFRKKAAPSAVHLFIEECQEFVPQNPQREEARMLHAFTRLVKIGRNFGIGVSLISQRPQEVNKKVLNLTELLFAFQLTGPQERKTVEGWIADKGLDEDISGELPKLTVGHPHVWSPAWLKVSKVVTIARRETFDSSSTPEVGHHTAARELSPIDLEHLRKEMAATIEKAKAEDPRELRRQLGEVRAELARLKAAPSRSLNEKKPVEIPVLSGKDIKAVEAAAIRIERAAERFVLATTGLEAVSKAGRELAAGMMGRANAITDALVRLRTGPAPRPPAVVAAHVAPSAAPRTQRAVAEMARAAVRAMDPDGPKPVEQRILNALAELEQLGANRPKREMVAFLADYTNLRSKGLVNALGALRSSGLIDYPDSDHVVLTATGRQQAQPPPMPRSPAELQARVLQLLGGASGRILQPLLDAYPEALAKDVVADKAGYGNLRSKGFVNAMGRLRSLGFIDYPDARSVVAKPILFLEGR